MPALQGRQGCPSTAAGVHCVQQPVPSLPVGLCARLPGRSGPCTNSNRCCLQGGEDDIDALLAKFKLQDERHSAVSIKENCAAPSPRVYASFTPIPSQARSWVGGRAWVGGGGVGGAWLLVWLLTCCLECWAGDLCHPCMGTYRVAAAVRPCLRPVPCLAPCPTPQAGNRTVARPYCLLCLPPAPPAEGERGDPVRR